jgi:uncharacterized DUF497 family protein
MSAATEFEWDEQKRRANIAKHGLDFTDAEELDWDTAAIIPSARGDFGETRLVVLGMHHGHVHVVIVTRRLGRTRIISFRKAKAKEVWRYESEKEKNRS